MFKTVKLLIFIIIMSTACSDKDYLFTIHTPYGDMKAVLYDVTPKHKENFLKLTQEGMYDSTIFHRVIKDFMIQGGDVLTKKGADPKDEKLQEIAKNTIPAEFVDTLFHKKGALAAARQGDQVNPKKASSGCQFYIVQGKKFSEAELTIDQNKLNNGIRELLQMEEYDSLRQELIALYNANDFEAYTKKILETKPLIEKELNIKLDKDISPKKLEAYTTIGGAPHLDDTYTVFGEVVDGLAVIDSVADQPMRGEKPVNDIYMTVTVEEVPKKKITEMYGYSYPEE